MKFLTLAYASIRRNYPVWLCGIFYLVSAMVRLAWGSGGNDERFAAVFTVDGMALTSYAFGLAGMTESGSAEFFSVYGQTPIVSGWMNTENLPGLGSRILYPLLSFPFVMLLGIHAMLVPPSPEWPCSSHHSCGTRHEAWKANCSCCGGTPSHYLEYLDGSVYCKPHGRCFGRHYCHRLIGFTRLNSDTELQVGLISLFFLCHRWIAR